MNKTLFCFVVLSLGSFVGLRGSMWAETKESAAFGKLRALKGDWQGTVAWTGQQPSEVGAYYYITGSGSAVVEDLSNGMTSVFTLTAQTSK